MWHYLNQLLMSWFYSLVTKGMLNKIIGLTTTLKIWNTLERTYVVASHSRVLELCTEIQSIKKDGLVVDEYVLKLKNIANKLASIGEPVSDWDQLIYLFQGLGVEYNPFETSFNARFDQPIIEKVRSLLLSFNVIL